MALCECGCGEATEPAPKTRSALGWIKGQPKRFINGHNTRKPRHHQPVDRGFRTLCWEWQGTLSYEGYGLLRIDYKQIRAHRWMYEQKVGPIPEGLHLDHLCRNVRCVNPDHLEPVTPRVNGLRGRSAKITAYGAFSVRLMGLTTTLSDPQVAEIFGMTPSNVSAIRRGKSWPMPSGRAA